MWVRIGVIIVFAFSATHAARIQELLWPSGKSFSQYLDAHKLSRLLRSISDEDMKYVTDIRAGERYYELRDEEGLRQALIPIGEAMQIQLRRQLSGHYTFDIIPIVYREARDAVSLTSGKHYYQAINHQTALPRLSYVLREHYKGDIDLRTLQAGDRLAFVYSQKSRLGHTLGSPRVTAALLKTRGREHFVYVDAQGNRYRGVKKIVQYRSSEKRPFTYTTVRKVPGAHFRMPVDHARITSRFSLRRWHPILHRYRPHYGVDFGAGMGTPLRAVNDGKVVYAGWMRGYGRVVKIDHGGGLVSLYAHQSKMLVKPGQYVKRSQIIGKVGSSGRSTGPHLHFGLYRNGKPVDPLLYISRKGTGTKRTITEKHTVMKTYPVIKKRLVQIPGASQMKKRLARLIQHDTRGNIYWKERKRSVIHVHDITEERPNTKGAVRD